MGIQSALKKEWNKFTKRGWEKFYIAVDLHDTVFQSNYDGLAYEYLPNAKRVLQKLSSKPEVVLIMYTSSHKNDIEKYNSMFVSDDIFFDYVNSNPCEDGNHLSCFDQKFYFNILIDDKAGFESSDWNIIEDFFFSDKKCITGNYVKKAP